MKQLNLLRNISLDNSFEIDISELRSVSLQKFDTMTMSIPLGGISRNVVLKRVNIFSENFKVTTSDGVNTDWELGEHYRGEIEGEEKSFCSLSFTNNEVFGHIVTTGLTYDITFVSGSTYRTLNIGDETPIEFTCHHEPKEGQTYTNPYNPSLNTKKNTGLKTLNPYVADQATRLVKIDWVADYDIYFLKGANTVAYITSIFNASKTLFENDGIFVVLNFLHVFTTGFSPYRTTPVSVPSNDACGSSACSMIYMLFNFRFSLGNGIYPAGTSAANFTGDLKHLLTANFPYSFASTSANKISGLADGIQVLCNPISSAYTDSDGFLVAFTDSPVCFSQIDVNALPNSTTYSSTVQVVTHEQGHLMGSNHTHGCYWNTTNFVPGGNPIGCSRIDSCVSGETATFSGCPTNVLTTSVIVSGVCPFPGVPQNSGGTIMSYCALNGGAQLFSNGFGPQPQQRIVNFINSLSCLQSLDITPTPTPTLTSTPTRTMTKTPTESVGTTPNPTTTVTPTKTQTQTATPSIGVSPNPTTTPTVTPTNTVTKTNTRTKTPTPTQTPTVTPSNNDECSNCTDQYPCLTQTPTPTQTQLCNTIVSASSTNPVFYLPLKEINSVGYTNIGTRFYVNGFQFGGSGSTYYFSNTTDVWKNTNITDGPLNRSGVWTINPFPANTWMGFSFCIDVPSVPTYYYVGFGADNAFRLTVDGIERINTTLGGYNNSTLSFSNWHVYPIILNPGHHVFNVYGLNLIQTTSGVFGCEIYSNTINELTGATSVNDLNIIFSTNSYSSSFVQLVQTSTGLQLTSGYTCPSGYVYELCNNDCVRFIPCPDPTLTPTNTNTPTQTKTPGLSPNQTPTPTSTMVTPTQTPTLTKTPTRTKTMTPTTQTQCSDLCPSKIIQGTVNGVTVSYTLSGDASVSQFVQPFIYCQGLFGSDVICQVNTLDPLVAPLQNNLCLWAGRNGNPWSITFNFSPSIDRVVFVIGAWGMGGDENVTIVTNTGIPTITAQLSCFTTINGNTIIGGSQVVFGGPNSGGFYEISNPTPFTQATLSGIPPGMLYGLQIGICEASFYPPTPTPTPSSTNPTPTPTVTKTQTGTKKTPTPTKTQTQTPDCCSDYQVSKLQGFGQATYTVDSCQGQSGTFTYTGNSFVTIQCAKNVINSGGAAIAKLTGCGCPSPTPTPTVTPTPITQCSNIVFPNPQIVLNGITITSQRTGNTYILTQPPANDEPICGTGLSIQYPSVLLGNGLNGIGVTGPPSFFSNWSLSLDFSQPITSITIALRGGGCTCQYSPNDPENFWFTTNTGIPTISPVISCNSIINNNEIILNSSNPSWLDGKTGDGIFVITNCAGFTNLTLTGDGGYLGTAFGICDTSVETGPCVSPTPTTTQTMTVTPSKTRTTVIQDCSVFYLNNTQLFYYNVDTNVSINVGSVANEIGNPNNIAHTENRLFIWGVNPQQTLWQIAVYSITFQPFSKTFIGYVTPFDGFYSTGLFAIDNNNILIGSYGAQTPSKLQKWDITDLNNPIITDIITLPSGFTLASDILLNQCGKVQFGAVGNGGRYILQYDYNNPTPQPEVTLYMGPNAPCSILPSGLFAKDDKLYFVNYADSGCPFSSPDEIWEIDTFPPYTFVKLYTLPPTVSDVNGASSLYSCSNACLITFTGTPTPTPTQTITNTPTITKTKTQTPTKLSNLCTGRFIAPTTHKGVNMTVIPTGDVITVLSPAVVLPSCGQMTFNGIPAYMCGGFDNFAPTPASSFSLTFNFDLSVNNVAVVLNGAGWGGNENFVFTTNTGIPTISSTFNCYSTISGNQILSGLGAPCCNPTGPTGGAGVFIINNTNPYTTLTITGAGGWAGTFINICDFDAIQITQTPTPTKTITPTNSQTLTPTNTITQTNTKTPTRSVGATPPPTNSQTPTTTPTNTKTSTPTTTETPTQTPTKTATQTKTPTPTRSMGATPPPTNTQTPTPTNTGTPTQTKTTTQTVTQTQTKTQTSTPTDTPPNTPTKTKTPTNTPTPTTTLPKTPDPTLTQTVTPTITKTKTKTPNVTPTNTQTLTQTPTDTPPCVPPLGLLEFLAMSQFTINGTLGNYGGSANAAIMCNAYYRYTAATNSSVTTVFTRYFTGGTPNQGGRIYGNTNNCSCTTGNRQYGINRLNPSQPVNKTDGLRVVQWVPDVNNNVTCFFKEMTGNAGDLQGGGPIPPGLYYWDC